MPRIAQKKDLYHRLEDMGIIKRKLTKPEREEIVNTVQSVFPKGGDAALDFALALSIEKVSKGES